MTIIILVFLLAGLIKGVIGLGLPTIAMGLLSVVMPPSVAASLLIIPSLVTNLWQLLIGPNFIRLFKRLWTMNAAIILGSLVSPLPSLNSGSSWTQAALGWVIVAYGLWGLAAKAAPNPSRHERWLSPIMGYITGAISAATGLFVIPAVPYLQALQLNKNDLVQALGLAFTASTIGLALQLAKGDALAQLDYSQCVVALIAALVGMFFGQHLRRHISEIAFRRCFFIGLIALGVYMAWR
ncbi:sulfite exporter TauE/SafE family protein [Pseudomonas sp. 5P_3.1_Bac2]|uniref:sulfite exporter TauE/SafE family protein n=1 Tax=Pseudomonas sp. 5P_3.1_Bac2 TaxID=2971617 RepID=UPI0021C86E03|nr:sulfite exporter TauE/SafE family protein [Pseudomonas sp. 5P_3.1_Bac2]MCU1715849.1 sulfite exporter TauE/SafE family protein [Pseudomonas sp. 5P_3.1_Bac2]